FHSYFAHSRPPAALHSFPTRRSSDLEPGLLAEQLGHDPPGLQAAGQRVAVLAVVGEQVVARLQGGHQADDGGLLAEVEMAVAAEDRKSTRLNSSHVAISYAVFCLKKK